MTDLREKVSEDEGLLKKIELAIPGFRGYRKREDLRIADSLLREQLANRVHKVQQTLEAARDEASRAMELDILNDFGSIINKVKGLEGKLRHAEQGYSGISSDYRIEESEQNKLYEYDLNLLRYIDEMSEKSNVILADARSGGFNKTRDIIREVHSKADDFEDALNRRIEVISGLEALK